MQLLYGKERAFQAHLRTFFFHISAVPEKLGVYKLEISSSAYGRRGPLLAGFDTSFNFILRLRIKDDLVLDKLSCTQWEEWA